MKKAEFINPNKMEINTGIRIFDNQTNLITTGSAFCNTQKSMIVHAYNKTKESLAEGDLQNYDLSFFKTDMPSYVEEKIRKLAAKSEVYVYEFFHTNKKQTKVVHGYVVTTKDHEFLNYFVIGPTHRSYGVVQECAKYVSDYNITTETRKRMTAV